MEVEAVAYWWTGSARVEKRKSMARAMAPGAVMVNQTDMQELSYWNSCKVREIYE